MENLANKTRLSLTKSQTQAGAGAELLALCQSLTESGSISDAGAHGLKRWLLEHRSTDLPSVEFLTSVVEQVVTDNVITPEQRKTVYKAIETVLPPEARKTAVVHRKAAELVERERAHAVREVEKQHAREERERNRPLDSANFMVAGVNHEGRSVLIREYVKAGDQVFLIRDRQNKFSRNAVEIRLQNGYQIGFVPEQAAVYIAPLLDKGCLHRAVVTKVLEGRKSPIPVVQSEVYLSNSGAKDAVPEAAIPQKRIPSSVGCLGLLVFVAGLLGMLGAWLVKAELFWWGMPLSLFLAGTGILISAGYHPKTRSNTIIGGTKP